MTQASTTLVVVVAVLLQVQIVFSLPPEQTFYFTMKD